MVGRNFLNTRGTLNNKHTGPDNTKFSVQLRTLGLQVTIGQSVNK